MNKKLNVEKLVKELTIEEKAALLSGTDFMCTNPVPRLNIPQLRMADGPHGIRKQIGKADNGVTLSEPATAFPTAALTASGWNTENLYKMGQAMADECRTLGIQINLGPAVNIKRNPRCGRNFEYFSEDPQLTGALGSALAEGLQSKGIGVSVKHFAANNAEDNRFVGDSIVDERALREIYLRGFETIVKKVKPYTVMCAYNKLNGELCSENKRLLTDILRNEWGFDGIVMSDWGAVKDRVKGVLAGLDLEMPGDTAYCRKNIIDATKNGTLSEEILNKAVKNVLNLINKCLPQKDITEFNKSGHHELSVKIAADSAVLFKNDGSLPLNKEENILILGELFEKMRYQGSGSSLINPTFLVTPKNAFDNAKINYTYKKGYLENGRFSKKVFNEAVEASEKFDKVVLFAGLTDYAESEGFDRTDLKLPKNQTDLIEKLIAQNKKIILILFGGSPVELPFLENTAAILNMYLPGQGGGEACKKLIFGEVNPSGKLAETWVKSYNDVPFGEKYSKTTNELYKESIFVGYRYYDAVKKEVMFPFGYGLSYTKFEYFNIEVKEENGIISVFCDVKNTGTASGAEIVQVYVKNNKGMVFKADKELRAFTKAYLKAGETKKIETSFYKNDLSYYNTDKKAWILENGIYEILIAASSADIKLSQKFEIKGEKHNNNPYTAIVFKSYKEAEISKITDSAFEQVVGYKMPKIPPVKPFTMETKFGDFKKSFMGRIVYRATTKFVRVLMKKAQKMPDSAEKDNGIKGALFLKKSMDNICIRSFSMNGGKDLPYNAAEGIVEMANGHLGKGRKKMKEVIVVPPLPKDLV